jgi:hypothetical protein
VTVKDPMTNTAPAQHRRGRRRAVAVAPLAATVLGLGRSTGTADAALRSRTDTITFTNRAGVSVTCTVGSFHELSDVGRVRASTTLSGPADCTASFMSLFLQYSRSNGESRTAEVEGEGRFLPATLDAAAVSVQSSHFVSLPASECSHGHRLRQSK